MLEVPRFRKLSELLAVKLWTTITDHLFWATISRKMTLEPQDHCTGEGVGQLIYLPEVTEIVDCDKELLIVDCEEVDSDPLPWSVWYL